MKWIGTLIYLFVFGSAQAGNVLIAKSSSLPPVESHIVIEAEFVAVPVTIRAEHKHPAERFRAIQKAKAKIKKKLKAESLQFEPGVISLSPEEGSMFSKRRYAGTTIQLYAIGALSEQRTIYKQTESIYRALKLLKEPDDISFEWGNATVGINNPEKHRPALLRAIAANLANARKSLGATGKAQVSGLHNPVTVQRDSESRVSVYIPHNISIEW